MAKVCNAFTRLHIVFSILFRILPNGDHGPLCTSQFPLPNLQPPHTGIIALLELPSFAKLHAPVHARLTLRNHHPSRSASLTVQLEPDATDAFLIAGQRKARVPTLLPGSEAQLVWSLIPMGCGFVQVPRIHVVDKRKAGLMAPPATEPQSPQAEEDGTPVWVFDLRRDDRVEMVDADEAVEDRPDGANAGSIGPILVLP
jgi:trafficking protein particle complex subunit 11